MNVIAVESRTLAAVAYDDAREVLQLEFRSRAVYRYFGVPAPVCEGLLSASSKGEYVQRDNSRALSLCAGGKGADRRGLMARTVASLPVGSRITDYISLGVVARCFPREKVDAVLKQTERASVRERDLPAHVVVYYVIALALYMRSSYREVLRCLLEGVQWLLDPSVAVKVAGKSGISQARTRLGAEPVKALYDAVVAPIAQAQTKGA